MTTKFEAKREKVLRLMWELRDACDGLNALSYTETTNHGGASEVEFVARLHLPAYFVKQMREPVEASGTSPAPARLCVCGHRESSHKSAEERVENGRNPRAMLVGHCASCCDPEDGGSVYCDHNFEPAAPAPADEEAR